MASKVYSVRLSEEDYTYINNVVSKGEFKSVSEFIQNAVSTYIENRDSDTIEIFKDNDKILSLEKDVAVYKQQVIDKDEQLKIKDQQIFSLIAVQKDLTEKTTQQVKLLTDKLGSKKWYEFWK